MDNKTDTRAGSSASSAGLIGQRLKELRRTNNWTLTDVAQRTGISVGTLSKLENGKTELNFTSVNKLASGLGLRVTELTHPAGSVSGQRTLTRADAGTVFTTREMDIEILCSDLTNAQQGYLRAKVRAHDLDTELPWHRHTGQEFLYVLSGTLILYTELYEPVTLRKGDSILFDSSMGHHYCSKGRADAEILINMSLGGYENVADTFRPRRATK